MTEKAMPPMPPMPDTPASFVDTDLEQRSNEDLAALVARATQILEGREHERKKKALEEIRKIAKSHGLSVNVAEAAPKRKRGRPPKQREEIKK